MQAQPGAAYTIAGTGRSAELGLSVLNDKLDMPPAGKASVRVINAALSVPLADVGPVDGRVWAQDVKFGTETSYVDCPLGNWDLKVSSDQTSATVPLTLRENSTYTVVLIDQGSGLEPQVKRDSTGAGTVPTGGVDTLGCAAARNRLPLTVAAATVLLVAVHRGGPRGPRADRDALTGWTSAGRRDRGRPDGGGPRPIAPRRGCLARSRGWRWRSRWGWACLPP